MRSNTGRRAGRGSQKHGVRKSRPAGGSPCMDAQDPFRQGAFRPDQGCRRQGRPRMSQPTSTAPGGKRAPLEWCELRGDCGRVALQPWPGSHSSRRPCPTASRGRLGYAPQGLLSGRHRPFQAAGLPDPLAREPPNLGLIHGVVNQPHTLCSVPDTPEAAIGQDGLSIVTLGSPGANARRSPPQGATP